MVCFVNMRTMTAMYKFPRSQTPAMMAKKPRSVLSPQFPLSSVSFVTFLPKAARMLSFAAFLPPKEFSITTRKMNRKEHVIYSSTRVKYVTCGSEEPIWNLNATAVSTNVSVSDSRSATRSRDTLHEANDMRQMSDIGR